MEESTFPPIQYSFFIGPNGSKDRQIVVRGYTMSDVAAHAESLVDSGEGDSPLARLLAVGDTVNAVMILAAPGLSGPPAGDATTTTAAGQYGACSHGDKVLVTGTSKTGNPYKRVDCPLKAGPQWKNACPSTFIK